MLKGSISIFISLIMSVILMFSSAICESIRFRGAKIAGVCAADAAVESALSKYDEKLLEEFGIFGSYYEDKQALLSLISEDIEKNLYPEGEFLLLKDSDFWQLSLTDINAKEYELLTDNGGDAFYRQAVEFAKNNMVADFVELLVDYAGNNKDPDSIEAYFDKEEQETDKKIEEYESQSENENTDEGYEYSGEIIEVDQSPVDVVKEIKQSGILSLVIPGNEQISGNYVDINSCVSKRTLSVGNVETGSDSNLADKAMYIEYLTEMLTDFSNDIHMAKGFNYQLEYCIGGKDTDDDNLRYVVNRLLLIKEASNFTYLLTDSVKKSQALAVAAGLVGATGIQPLVEAVKYAILLAWAYAESIVDVRNLLNGGSVALVKTGENWRLSIENIGSLSNACTEPVNEKYGLDYTSYLKLLMCFMSKDELVMRGMDIIELKMQDIYDNADYKLDKLIASLSITSFYSTEPVFLKFRLMKNYGYNSDFNVTSKLSYI